jgi:hypothetical protein
MEDRRFIYPTLGQLGIPDG